VSTDYDVRAAIRSVINETDLASPDDISDKVATNVPERQLRAVLADVLREFVRVELTRHRSGIASPVASQSESPVAAAAVSAKRAAIVDYAARWLRERVAVAENEWKLLGDCHRGDLLYLAEARRRNAERSLSAAGRYDRYAVALAEHGAARVADLPHAVIAAIESAVAA